MWAFVRPPAQRGTPHLRDGFRVAAGDRPPREKHRRPVDDETLFWLPQASPRWDGGERPRVRLERLLAVRLPRVERLVSHGLSLVVEPENTTPRGRVRNGVAEHNRSAVSRLTAARPERHQTRLGRIQRVAVKLFVPTLEAVPLIRVRRAQDVRLGLRPAPARASSETQKTPRRPRQRRGQEPAKAGHGGDDDERGAVQHRRRRRVRGVECASARVE
jgi:hypothetical protein